MNWKEMLEKASALVAQASKLLNDTGDKITPEQKAQADAWLKEAEDLSKRAEELQGDESRSERLAKLNAHLNQAVGSPSAAPTSGFKNWTEFILAVRKGTDPRLQPADSLFSAEERKGMAEGAGATGGFLVPPEFRAELLEVPAEAAVVRPRAFVLPMGSRSVEIPMLDQTTAQAAGTTAFFGGVALEWFEENTDLDEQDPKFKLLELVAHGLGGWLPVPNSLIANSAVSLGAMIPRLFGGAVAWGEDYAFLRGNGVKKPLGVLNAPCLKTVLRNTDSSFVFVDAVTMLAGFLPSSWTRGVWVMHPTVIPKLYQMADSGSNLIWLPNAAEKGPGTLLGMPIVFTEKLPVLGSATGAVLLADFSYYVIGDRQATAIEVSTHERFRKNQTTYRVTQFVDGQPWLDAPITLADGATTLSPFVALEDS